MFFSPLVDWFDFNGLLGFGFWGLGKFSFEGLVGVGLDSLVGFNFSSLYGFGSGGLEEGILVGAFTSLCLLLSVVFLSSVLIYKGLFSMKDGVGMMGGGCGIGIAEMGFIKGGASVGWLL